MELSVVIPVYNEADNVQRVWEEVRTCLDGQLTYEIVFVDDCSSDDTLDRLRALQRATASVRVIQHRYNAGQSAAIASGVRTARHNWVVTLDGDGQNDPADIPAMLRALGPIGADIPGLVAGWRRHRHDGRVKRIASRIANGVRRTLLGDGCPDTGCGLKLFRREHFLGLPQFDHMHRFLPALFRAAGLQVVIVPVSHRPRRSGDSKYGVGDRLWAGIVDLLGVRWLERRTIQVATHEESRA